MPKVRGTLRSSYQVLMGAAPRAAEVLGPTRTAAVMNKAMAVAGRRPARPRHWVRTAPAEQNASSMVHLCGSQVVQVQPPDDEQLTEIWRHELCHVIPNEVGGVFENMRVCGTSGWLVTPSNAVVDDLWLDTWSPAQRFADEIIADLRGPAIHLDSTVLVIGTPYGSNYYHWLMQLVPRLRHLRELEQLAGEAITHIVGPQLRHSFQHEMLGLLGLTDRYIAIPPRTHVVAKRVVASTIPTDNAHVRRDTIEFLVAVMGAQTERNGPALLIRRGTARRPFLQEKQLTAALDARGFEIICPGELSFAEQVRRFSTAPLVVGVHGADLTNTVFCQPGAGLVELVPRNYAASNFFLLTRAREAPYQAALGDEPDAGAADARIAAAALSLEPRRVLRLIDQLA